MGVSMRKFVPYAAIILVAIVVSLILLPTGKWIFSRGDSEELGRVMNACSMGGQFSANSNLDASVESYLSKLHAGASITTNDVGALINKITSDQSGAALYKEYTECLQQQMAIYLTERGIKIIPPSHADDPDDRVVKGVSMFTPETPADRIEELMGKPISVGAAEYGRHGLILRRYQYKYGLFVADFRRNGNRVGLVIATNDPLGFGDKLPFNQISGVKLRDLSDCDGSPQIDAHFKITSGVCGGSHEANYIYSVYFFDPSFSNAVSGEMSDCIGHGSDLLLDKCQQLGELEAFAVAIAKDSSGANEAKENFLAELDFGGTFQWLSPEASEKYDRWIAAQDASSAQAVAHQPASAATNGN
jgi:hypothetical protein